MATSGVYSRSPTAGELAMIAFARAGVRRTDITAEHMSDAQNEAHLMMAAWSSDVPHLWTSELYPVSLIDGTTSYALPERIIDIQTAYISTTASSITTDRVIGALSTAEYAGIPNKATEGAPTSYWLDKQITPTVYLWPTPDATSTYTLNLRCVSRFQDTLLASGTEAEVPYRFQDAFVWGLALRLAAIYQPERVQALQGFASGSLNNAKTQDTDDVPIKLAVNVSGYWR